MPQVNPSTSIRPRKACAESDAVGGSPTVPPPGDALCCSPQSGGKSIPSPRHVGRRSRCWTSALPPEQGPRRSYGLNTPELIRQKHLPGQKGQSGLAQHLLQGRFPSGRGRGARKRSEVRQNVQADKRQQLPEASTLSHRAAPKAAGSGVRAPATGVLGSGKR